MFYLNEEKLKEYSVVNYLKTDKFKNQIKPKLLRLIKSRWKENSFSKLFKTREKILSPLNLKLDFESLQQINRYSSYIGKWSEFLLESLTKHCNSQKEPNLVSFEFNNYWEIIRETTQKAKRYFESKKERVDSWVWFYELENLPEYKYSFLLEKEEFEKNEDSKVFILMINHFKELLPYFKNCINWEKFTKQYQTKSSLEHKNECEITQWEFDFYNYLEKEIIELKFHKKGWEPNWLWQTLLYVYLLDFYYALRVEKIRIINTFAGESLSLNLSDLFIKGGKEEFYSTLKQEISDYEKIRFMNRILSSFKDWTLNSNLGEIISNNFFCDSSNPMILKYLDFMQELNKHRGKKDFLSNIHSSNWIWAQWTRFLAERQ